MINKLLYGDNLNVLREQIADESVDLIYLDPPFNSNAITLAELFQSMKPDTPLRRSRQRQARQAGRHGRGQAGEAAVSDLKLFRIEGSEVTQLSGGPVALEKTLQQTFETNLEALLGVRFLASA